MTTTLLVIRHGQTDSNTNGHYMGWSQEDLNQQGYGQAGLLSKRLANVQIDSIYTSPLKRAQSTAQAVAGPHNIKPVPMDDLIEINRIEEVEVGLCSRCGTMSDDLRRTDNIMLCPSCREEDLLQ